MNDAVTALMKLVPGYTQLSERERHTALRSSALVRSVDDEAIAYVVTTLATLPHDDLHAALPLVEAILQHVAQRARVASRNSKPSSLPAEQLGNISKLYNDLRDSAPAAWALAGWLAALRGRAEIALLAEWLATTPPQDAPQLAVALGPLFQRADYDASALFPRLLDALSNPQLAGAVLDLANYLTREERLAEHPAKARVAELATLLGAIVQRLGQIEEEPDADERTPQEVAAIIAESLPLAVSLCDALGLIGDPQAIGKLHQAMELRHRRLRAEAAAALARLKQKAGEDILVELAAEPVARLRVLAYAQELGFIDRVDPQYNTAAASAEAQLALWLSQPSQFGIPPTSLELIDEREQYWPSYEDPVECYLFRFQYDLGGATYANIGIAGPMEHAFNADLADLPPDDIYAAFAGWQAQHEEIREHDVSVLNESGRVEITRLERRLHDHAFEAIKPVTLGTFFGERVLVTTAVFDRHPGVAIVTSGGEITWLARNASSRPLGPVEAYSIFKGRRLLRTFNV